MTCLVLITIVCWFIFICFLINWGKLSYTQASGVYVKEHEKRHFGLITMMFGFITLVLSLACIIMEFQFA